ncbi:MAG: discoidin domain-containing protein [Pseudomonadota bacterium]
MSNQSAGPGHGWKIPLLLLALAVLVRCLFLVYINLDADMAVTGLMGRHIIKGHWPIFFYGQPFCGAIEAYVAAGIFALLGSSPLTLSLAPTLLGLVFVLVVFLAARDMWGRRAALWAMLFAACPPYYFALHSVLPRAAYIEIPLLSLLLIWMAFRLAHRRATWWLYLLYGLAAGIGFWTHFLIAYALVASALYLVAADWRLLFRRGHALIWGGFVLGSLPLWVYNLRHDWGTFTFLTQPKDTVRAWEVLRTFLDLGAPVLLGAFKDGTHDPMLPVVSHGAYALGLAALGYLLWLRRRGLARLARLDASQADGSELFLLMLLAGMLITMLRGEPVVSSRRHFVPFYAALIPLAGYALARLQENRRWWAWGLGALALASNLAGLGLSSAVCDPRIRHDIQGQVQERQKVIATLLEQGVTRAYSQDYWNCPLITFESGERLLLDMPQEELDHFYEPNARLVAQADQTVYLGRRGSHSIRQMLHAMGANYKELSMGSYTAFLEIRPPFAGLREVTPADWRAHSALMPADLDLAFDNDALTRWSPLEPQRPGQALELDLGRVVPGLCLVRLASGRVDDQPRCLQVFLSLDGLTWTRVTKMGTVEWPFFWSAGRALDAPDSSRLDLGFAPHDARYLRLVQTCAADLNYWSVQELRLYQAAPAGERPDRPAVVDFARRHGARWLYAEACLRGFVPADLRPARQDPPKSAAWPLAIAPYDVLPADLEGVMVAVEAHDGPRLARFLERRRAAFQRDEVGGFSVFWRISLPRDDGRRLPQAGISLRSSHQGGEVRLLDGNPATAWDSGRPMQPGDFVELALPWPRRLSGLILDNRPNPRELPRGLVLSASEDGRQWREVPCQQLAMGPLIFAGDGLLSSQDGRLRLSFAPTQARYLRLSLSQGHPKERWSIYELHLEEAPAQP